MTGRASQSGYVASGPLRVFYDIRGSGQALLLLHGGMGTNDLFGELRPDLARRFTTVAVEQQGHGHTADVDRPLGFSQMADDTAEVIRVLEIGPCHVLGYSDGGNVALGLAIRHPDLVDRIAICGANADNAGLRPDLRNQLIAGAKQDPATVAAAMPDMLRDAYAAVAPDPNGWPMLVHKVFDLAAAFEGWTEAELQAITSPVLVMSGDHDAITVEHAAWLASTLTKGQLCILPRTDHLAPVSRAGWISPIVTDFFTEDLDAPMPMDAAHT